MSSHFARFVASLVLLTGCSIDGNAPTVSSEVDVRDTEFGTEEQSTFETFRFDCGAVIAGEDLAHSFTFTNDGNESIALSDKDGIAKSCGCTEIRLGKESLEPGETTNIHVRVATGSHVGVVSNGARVNWQTASGRIRTASFEVRGITEPLLTCSVPRVEFDAKATREQQPVVVYFTSTLPIDWPSVVTRSRSQYCTINTEQTDKCTIKAVIYPAPLEGEGDCHDEVMVSGVVSTRSEKGSQILISIPVDIQQTSPILVRPRSATATLPRPGECVKLRFHLRGEPLAATDFDAVIAQLDQFDVTCSFERIKDDAYWFDLVLVTNSVVTDRRSYLNVAGLSDDAIAIPILWRKVE